MLRETIMGHELFDKAFKEYAQRWAFKHPKPADFFRTMEDASAVDLDWFWKGWFYTTDVCNQSIDQVKWFQDAKRTKLILRRKNLNVTKGDLATSPTEASPWTSVKDQNLLVSSQRILVLMVSLSVVLMTKPLFKNCRIKIFMRLPFK